MRLEDVFSISEMRLEKDRSLKDDVMIRNTENPDTHRISRFFTLFLRSSSIAA